MTVIVLSLRLKLFLRDVTHHTLEVFDDLAEFPPPRSATTRFNNQKPYVFEPTVLALPACLSVQSFGIVLPLRRLLLARYRPRPLFSHLSS